MRLPLKLNPNVKYALGRWLPFLKVPPPPAERSAALTLRPGRNSLLTWEKRDTGEMVLTVPHNDKANRLAKLLAKFMKAPNERHVELDEVGGYVWELCDGQNTVESIVQKTGRQYKMNRREAEVSVTMFLQMLHQRNFIGFYKKTGKNAVKDKSKSASRKSQETSKA